MPAPTSASMSPKGRLLSRLHPRPCRSAGPAIIRTSFGQPSRGLRSLTQGSFRFDLEFLGGLYGPISKRVGLPVQVVGRICWAATQGSATNSFAWLEPYVLRYNWGDTSKASWGDYEQSFNPVISDAQVPHAYRYSVKGLQASEVAFGFKCRISRQLFSACPPAWKPVVPVTCIEAVPLNQL